MIDWDEAEDERPVYIIRVAAQLTGVHPRTLRIYEAKGLVKPKRTAGNVRLFSPNDLEKVRKICYFMKSGHLNLAGVRMLFRLAEELHKDAEELMLGLLKEQKEGRSEGENVGRLTEGLFKSKQGKGSKYRGSHHGR